MPRRKLLDDVSASGLDGGHSKFDFHKQSVGEDWVDFANDSSR